MSSATELVARIESAINERDLDGLVDCFADDVRSRQPAHPARDFVGSDQLRRNWAVLFDSVGDLHATSIRAAADGDRVFAEWAWDGTRPDGSPFALRGVTVHTVRDGRTAELSFYMEPVETSGASIDSAIREAAGR